ncbi:protein FAM110C [Clupea harengus]|uniref:Protein FAM110C n=1 Tax=Clupea harengus TaxID=7950 RepID=A0A6P8GJU0_CLUHA|nr:protein FAM110C [Clupea harengus]
MQVSSDVDTSRILEKGPEFLRKQLDLESEGKAGMTAAERLAASKPRYVKSQQVVNSTQESVISLNASSLSSNDSSNRSSSRSGDVNARNATTGQIVSIQPSPPEEPIAVRRSSSKKRPDSLLLYRQKCELIRRPPGDRHKRMQARKMLLNSIKDNTETVPETQGNEQELKATEADAGKGDSKHSNPAPPVRQSGQIRPVRVVDICAQQDTVTGDGQERPQHKRVAEIERRARKGVERSHSDISSRYSKNFADFDAFFTFCGLEGDVVSSLGKENFSALTDELANKIRSVSVSTSDDRFSRSSGDSTGLQEEELLENVRQATSVVERNARIIKWLYSCRNASESGKTLRDLA